MGGKNKPTCDLPKRNDSPSLDYKDFLKRTKMGKPSFYAYLTVLLDRKQKHESEDNSRINEFLRRNVGMDYEDFVNYARPEEIKEDSYGLFERRSIRISLFKSKAKAYLEALCDFEEGGGDVQTVLDDIRTEYVPTLKKHEGKEPTFEAIYAILKRS